MAPPEEVVGGRARRALERVVRARQWIARYPLFNLCYRVLVGIVGLAVLVLGIVMLPAPGPGWVVIFIGLGILATEFEFARKLLLFTREKYRAWLVWLSGQGIVVRAGISIGVLLLVAACVWLVGGFALVAAWLGIDWPWLASPLGLHL